jgi:hypothetical protein
MELVRDIAFTSKEFSDAWQIEKVRVSFNPDDIANIKKASAIIKENKFIENIRVAVSSDVTLLADEDEEVTSWEYDTIQFIVYDDVVYLYAQSKDDSADQIESEPFEIIML